MHLYSGRGNADNVAIGVILRSALKGSQGESLRYCGSLRGTHSLYSVSILGR